MKGEGEGEVEVWAAGGEGEGRETGFVTTVWEYMLGNAAWWR